MARDPRDAYDDWFDRELERLDDIAGEVCTEQDPDKILKIYDKAIEYAQKLITTCEEKDLMLDLTKAIGNADIARQELTTLQQDKAEYIENDYQSDKEWWNEQKKIEKEQKKKQAELDAVKVIILSDLRSRSSLRIVDIEKQHPTKKPLIRKAIAQLERERAVQKFKENNRLEIRICGEYNTSPDQSTYQPTQREESRPERHQAPEPTEPTNDAVDSHDSTKSNRSKEKKGIGQTILEYVLAIFIFWLICRWLL